MAYKVLNNIGLIDTSTNALTSLKTGLLVIVSKQRQIKTLHLKI